MFGQPTNLENESTFIQACVKGDMESIQRLLEQDPTLLKKPGLDGYSPFIVAVSAGQKEVVELFIRNGVEVDAIEQGVTALFCAAFHQKWTIAELLVENGARSFDVAPAEGLARGVTALWYAAARQQWALVQTMVANGARSFDVSPAEGSHRGKTALLYAAAWQQWALVQTMVANGARSFDASPEGPNRGMTALWYAAFFQQWALVQTMVANGARSFDVSPAEGLARGKTTLYWTAFFGQFELSVLLLSKGASLDILPDAKTMSEVVLMGKSSGTCPLGKHDNTFELLKAAEELFKLIADGSDNNLDNLIKVLSCALNAKKNGMTALHFAMSLKRNSIVEKLLCAGADPQITNKEGLTAQTMIAQTITEQPLVMGFPGLNPLDLSIQNLEKLLKSGNEITKTQEFMNLLLVQAFSALNPLEAAIQNLEQLLKYGEGSTRTQEFMNLLKEVHERSATLLAVAHCFNSCTRSTFCYRLGKLLENENILRFINAGLLTQIFHMVDDKSFQNLEQARASFVLYSMMGHQPIPKTVESSLPMHSLIPEGFVPPLLLGARFESGSGSGSGSGSVSGSGARPSFDLNESSYSGSSKELNSSKDKEILPLDDEPMPQCSAFNFELAQSAGAKLGEGAGSGSGAGAGSYSEQPTHRTLLWSAIQAGSSVDPRLLALQCSKLLQVPETAIMEGSTFVVPDSPQRVLFKTLEVAVSEIDKRNEIIRGLNEKIDQLQKDLTQEDHGTKRKTPSDSDKVDKDGKREGDVMPANKRARFA